jgi:hypothetical protein
MIRGGRFPMKRGSERGWFVAFLSINGGSTREPGGLMNADAMVTQTHQGQCTLQLVFLYYFHLKGSGSGGF